MVNRNSRRDEAMTVIQPFIEEWMTSTNGDRHGAFRNWAVEQVLWEKDISHQEIEASITDAPRDMGIDAWYLDDSVNPQVLYLFQSKDTRAERADLAKMSDGLQGLLDPTRGNQGNQEIRTRAAEFKQNIESLGSDSPIDIEFHLVTSEVLSTQLQAINTPYLETGSIELLGRPFRTTTYTHDVVALSLNLRILRETPIDICFSVNQSDYFSYTTPNQHRTVSAAIRADELAELFNEHKINLFRLNPRYYLNTRTKVNEKIIRTLEGDDASDFYLYNNGITATCSGVTPRRLGEGRVQLDIKDIQIVNGCQTTASIFEIWRSGRSEHLSRVRVNLKLIETQGPRTLASYIAHTTNDQNPIKPEDHRSIEPLQIRLHAEFNQFVPPWFYENKRGEWTTEYRSAEKKRPYSEGTYATRKMIMKDVGQAAWAFLGHPEDAFDRPAMIFGDESVYSRVFPNTLTARQLLLPYMLYLEASKCVEENAANYEWSTRYLRYPLVYGVARLIRQLSRQPATDSYLDVDDSVKLTSTIDNWKNLLMDLCFEALAREVQEQWARTIDVRSTVRQRGWTVSPINGAATRIIDRLGVEYDMSMQQGIDPAEFGLRANFPLDITL